MSRPPDPRQGAALAELMLDVHRQSDAGRLVLCLDPARSHLWLAEDHQHHQPKGSTMTKTTSTLEHAEDCPQKRTETTDYPDLAKKTLHCLDCGAHAAFDAQGNKLPKPTVTGALAGTPDLNRDLLRSVTRDAS